MRIQHNIPAMSAYRNYTNNVSAMKKNLEKLSSGYKINRAGDDAAGLAISEKMRAQITGLQTAQKNAKDGISLVQTAEGALTEVHDMLNRMVELATMSANGTYDNDTDRAQLQKEMNQLKSEINRIADSSNFNGIKLLDGSMDGETKYVSADSMDLFVNKEVNGTLQDHPLNGKDIMEKGGGDVTQAGFEVDFDGIGSVKIAEGEKFTLTIGGKKMTTDALDAGTYDAKKLADKLNGKEVEITDTDGVVHTFKATAEGTKLTFANTKTDEEDFQLSTSAKVGWEVEPADAKPTPTESKVEGTLNKKNQEFGAKAATAAQYTFDAPVDADNLKAGSKIKLKIGTGTEVTYTVVPDNAHDASLGLNDVNLADVNSNKGLAEFIADKLNSDTTFSASYSASVDANGKITVEANKAGAPGTGTGQSGVASLTGNTFTISFQKLKDDGTLENDTSITVDNTPSTMVTDTGTAAVAATHTVKINKADEAAIKAAADAADASTGDIAIKKSSGGKMALYAGDTKISEDVSYAAGNVAFKDSDGNVLLNANFSAALTDASFEGDNAIIDAAGIKTDLTYTAGGASGASTESIDPDAGIMMLDETGDTGSTGTPAGITGTLSGTVEVVAGSGTDENAKLEVTVALKDGSSGDVTVAENETVTIKAENGDQTFSYVFKKTNDGWEKQTSTELTGYTADFDGSKLTLTKDDAGATSLTVDSFGDLSIESTNSSVDTDNSTATGDFADGSSATAAKNVTLADADKDKIFAAIGSATIADNAKVTIKKVDDTKVGLFVGDEKISEVALGSPDGSTALEFKNANNDVLLKATFASGTTMAEIDAVTGGIDTGLKYKAASGGGDDPKPPVTDKPAEGASNNLVSDLTKTTELKKLTDFTADTQLDAAQRAELKTILNGMGTSGKIALTQAGGVEVNLKDIVTDADDTVGKVAQKIFAAADAAVKEANEQAGASGKQYEVVGVFADAACTVKLAGPESASSMALTAGNGFYIQTREKTASPDDPGTTTGVKKGTINSGLQNVTDENSGGGEQLAHVKVNFANANAWQDGAKITIGEGKDAEEYIVAVGKDTKVDTKGKNVINLTDQTAGSVDVKVAAQRLSVAANANKTFVVGHDGEGNTILKQRSAVKETTDMESQEQISKYLGVSTQKVSTDGKLARSLTLQIGDTAEKFNRLEVNIEDMHAEALGLNSINISDQNSASQAIDVIKKAINQVSNLRGTLGATQNRLDHTINNLSVMTENIQDAESTIRDVDVAEEMMAYTKNNILIQSAQAMLAQANQMPQGVLQLLQ